jgi:hypothetical protein
MIDIKQEKWDKAITRANKAIELGEYGRSSKIYYRRATAYVETGEIEKA